jgi:asparagine synthetase B (glutamine-hydrolysing)
LCGIAGFTHRNGCPDPERIRKATGTLGHRGPDQIGVYYSDEPSADVGALPIWYLSKLKLVLTKKQAKKYSKRKISDSHAYVAGRKA